MSFDVVHKASPGLTIFARLNKGEDLLEQLQQLVEQEDLVLGSFSVIGAVDKACYSAYHQDEEVYKPVNLDQNLEILQCSGNISLKDGQPFVHAHIIYGDHDGQTFGGHLEKGNPVFAGECVIYGAQSEQTLERHPDEATGLTLWS